MDPITYMRQDETDEVDQIFVETLEKVTKQIYERFKFSAPMIYDEAAKTLH